MSDLEFRKIVNEKHRNTIIPLSKYTQSKKRVHVTCTECNYSWNPKAKVIMRHGCPQCNSYKKSKGHALITEILDFSGIDFIPEMRFATCKYKGELSFDFYIPSHGIAIEFDGRQHFEPIKFFGGEKIFKEQQKRDQIKDIWCKNNGKFLLRIRFDDDIELRMKELIKMIPTQM